mgnify:FL=1
MFQGVIYRPKPLKEKLLDRILSSETLEKILIGLALTVFALAGGKIGYGIASYKYQEERRIKVRQLEEENGRLMDDNTHLKSILDRYEDVLRQYNPRFVPKPRENDVIILLEGEVPLKDKAYSE